MLHSLFPKFHRKSTSLPLLGPIVDGFDDWLAANGYTPASRKRPIRMLRHVDAYLRRRDEFLIGAIAPRPGGILISNANPHGGEKGT